MGFNSASKGLIWVVYSGEVGVEVDTRSRMCHGGWEVWVHGVSAIICIVEIICAYKYLSYTHTMCNTVRTVRQLYTSGLPIRPMFLKSATGYK